VKAADVCEVAQIAGSPSGGSLSNAQGGLPYAKTSAKRNHIDRALQQPMSKMRLGATCVLVRTMFWDGQVGQAQMQDMQRNGDDDNLSECSLTQTGPFWLAFSQNWGCKPYGTTKK
jgi:hypothetical protein